ncbi:hypothetical protein F5884DRAFT_471749 [Xylogone sp. PMI_703]|nr:hypothetical protein F5884DRAFT_471749 [Xylogone sp. PMI_703]
MEPLTSFVPAHILLPTEALSKLPPEIICGIAKRLSPESAAILSLTCRYLFNTLEETCLRPLMKRRRTKDFYNFLILLEDEFPNHIACELCRCLHRVTKQEASQYMPKSRELDFPNCHLKTQWRRRYDQDLYFFSFIISRMALRQFRQGQNDVGYYLKLLSSKELRLCNVSTIEWSSSLAKICQNQLFIRRQTIWTPSPTETNFSWLKNLCAHIQMGRSYKDIHVYFSDRRSPSRKTISKFAPHRKGKNDQIFQCRYCYTEFHIGFEKLDNKSLSMVCTTWHGFGEGRSGCDPKWEGHINEHFSFDPEHIEKIHFQPGSIKTTFQQKSGAEANPLITTSERRDLLKISKALKLKKSEHKTSQVRKCIDEFFDFGGRRDVHVGSKDAWRLYGSERAEYDLRFDFYESEQEQQYYLSEGLTAIILILFITAYFLWILTQNLIN